MTTSSPFGNAAYIDILTNHLYQVELSAAQVNELFGGTYITFEGEYVLKLIHETTHHWCFSSLVGDAYAATAIQVYAQLHRETMGVKTSDDMEEVLSDPRVRVFEKLEFTRILLTSITEGLALFAELDATHFDFPLVPPPIKCWLIAAGIAPDEMQDALDNLRGTEAFEQRRLNYYCQPFVSDFGGHLLGYAMVRGWIGKSGCTHSDLILSTIRTAFFENADLALLITDDQITGNDFKDRFIKRFDRIAKSMAKVIEIEMIRRGKVWPQILEDLDNQPLLRHYVGSKLDRAYIARVSQCKTENFSIVESAIDDRLDGIGVNRSGRIVEPSTVDPALQVFGEILLRVVLSRRYACLGTWKTSITLKNRGETVSASIGDTSIHFELPREAIPESVVPNKDEVTEPLSVGIYLNELEAGVVISFGIRYETIGSFTMVVENDEPICWKWSDKYDEPIAGEKASEYVLEWLDGLPGLMRYYGNLSGDQKFITGYLQNYGIDWLKSGSHCISMTEKKVHVDDLGKYGFLALVGDESQALVDSAKIDAEKLKRMLAQRE